jgi:hypothetical protein
VANDLQIQPVSDQQIRGHLIAMDAQLATMRFLPHRLAVLAKSVSSTQWPGQPERLSLPTGWQMAAADRMDAQAHLLRLKEALAPDKPDPMTASALRLFFLTRLQLGLPIARGTSEEAAEARGDFYEIALEDMPPWTVDKAIRRWIRREIGGLGLSETNTTFAPGPSTLRQICEDVVKPLHSDVIALERLLRTIPQSAAMDPAPVRIEPPAGAQSVRERAVPQLRRMGGAA